MKNKKTKGEPRMMPMLQLYYLSQFTENVSQDIERVIGLINKHQEKTKSSTINLEELDKILEFGDARQVKQFCKMLGVTVRKQKDQYSMKLDDLLFELKNELTKLHVFTN